MMELKVIKRDGSTEDFSTDKIRKVVIAAGLTPHQADVLIANLGKWAKMSQKVSVTSLEVRDQVLLQLEKIDAYAANMYRWYQKTKEK